MNPEKTNSVVGEARQGDSAYGTNDYAKAPALDTKSTGGVVGQPHVGASYGLPSLNSNVSVHNDGTTLMATASEANLSAKYKYPNVSQDVPAKGQNQFEDHS